MNWEGREWASGGSSSPRFNDIWSWALSIGTIAGIRIRLHLIFIIYIVLELIRSLIDSGFTLPTGIMLAMLACLFVVVLAHEFGHCAGSRLTGGQADDILMWPLGGLASCMPASNWSSRFWTVIAGPLVNVAICIVTIPLLGFITGQWWGVALPNPFLGTGLETVIRLSWVYVGLYLINLVSLMLLVFNLIPAYPLDGGRLLELFLARRMPAIHAKRLAVRIGLVAAIALGVFGVVFIDIGGWTVVIIAVFCGLTSWQTLKQLEMADEAMLDIGYEQPVDAGAERKLRRVAAQQAQEAKKKKAHNDKIDLILDKIAKDGLHSLNAREQRLLQQDTDRRRAKDERTGGR